MPRTTTGTGKWSRRCAYCGHLLPKTDDWGRRTSSKKRYCSDVHRAADWRLQRRIAHAVAAAIAPDAA